MSSAPAERDEAWRREAVLGNYAERPLPTPPPVVRIWSYADRLSYAPGDILRLSVCTNAARHAVECAAHQPSRPWLQGWKGWQPLQAVHLIVTKSRRFRCLPQPLPSLGVVGKVRRGPTPQSRDPGSGTAGHVAINRHHFRRTISCSTKPAEDAAFAAAQIAAHPPPPSISTRLAPVQCLLFFWVALWSGQTSSTLLYGIPPAVFWNSVRTWMEPDDLPSMLVKALVFGLQIAVLACGWGLTTSGGPKEVGTSTTGAVVMILVTVALVDVVLTQLLFGE